MDKEISFEDLEKDLKKHFKSVKNTKESIIVTKDGIPVVAIVNVTIYEKIEDFKNEAKKNNDKTN